MNKLNQGLLAVLVLQALFILGMNYNSASERKMVVKTKQMFPDMSADDVVQLDITGATEEKVQYTISLAKKDDKWVVANAGDYPTKDDGPTKVIKKLAKLKSYERVLASSTYHKKLKVAADDYRRKVTAKYNGRSTTFYVGTAPKYRASHIRIEGSDEVYLVNDFGESDLPDRGWGWVDRNYVNFPEKDVWSINIRNSHGTINLAKNPDTTWSVAGARKNQVTDVANIDALVRRARDITVENPVGKKHSLDYGFETPLASLTMVVGTSTTASRPKKD